MEQKSDLPILRLQIEDKNGNMVIQHVQAIHVVACEDTCSLTKEADNGDVVGSDGLVSLVQVVDSCNKNGSVVSDDEHIRDVLGEKDISFDHDVSDNAKVVDNPDDVTSRTTDSSEKAKCNAVENHEVVTRVDLTGKYGIHHYI